MFNSKDVVKFVLVNFKDDLDVPSFQPIEGTNPEIIAELADLD